MVAKKTTAKKPAKTAKTAKTTKKVSTKKAATKKPAPMKSFRIYEDKTPFNKVQLTRQTLYWVILLSFIVVTQLWLLQIQLDIANLTALLALQ